jgi:hypothetical protein
MTSTTLLGEAGCDSLLRHSQRCLFRLADKAIEIMPAEAPSQVIKKITIFMKNTNRAR